MGQSPGALVPWEGGHLEQRRGMAQTHECLAASICHQQHVSHSWCALLMEGGSADGQWDLAVPPVAGWHSHNVLGKITEEVLEVLSQSSTRTSPPWSKMG